MTALRWILIAFGVLLLAGIYWRGRRGDKAAAAADTGLRPDLQQAQVAVPAAAEMAEKPSGIEPVREDAAMVARVHANPGTGLGAASGEHIEPTFDAGMPAGDPATQAPDGAATDSRHAASSLATARRLERRKIIALRIAAGPQPFAGAALLAAFDAERLEHGKYQVFHRLGAGAATLFSVASMVEPGIFEPEKMPAETYPGMTLFAQLPGPAPGAVAFNELLACARRLQEILGGTLQDERGVPLTVHRIERLRQEVRDFETGPGREWARRFNAPPAPPHEPGRLP